MSMQQPDAGDVHLSPSEPPPAAPTLAEASRYWFKLGWVSFGGPAGQIALMHQELVERRAWIGERRFMHALNYCMLLPGPEAQQLATYIGWLLHGVRGGIIAGLLFVLPSLLIMIALAWAYLNLGAGVSAQLLYGVKPVVVGIVAFAGWRMGQRLLRKRAARAVAALSFAGVLAGWAFPLIVGLAALAGFCLREHFTAATSHLAAATGPRRAVIDDAAPSPRHAQVSGVALFMRIAAGVALGLCVYAALHAYAGAGSPLVQMARFFTQVALVTFGGAYAVMPYVFQQAVETHAWLTPAQMIDALALGETTPGPLIMVVAFVGYLGALAHSATPTLMTGIAGACVATLFTFLPSFLFILGGAPLVERTREDFRFDGPLSAVGAAVVGTIGYLAVVLARHVFWPAQTLDGFAVCLGLLSFVLLLRNKIGLIPLIALGAVLGGVYGYAFPAEISP